MVNRKVLGQGPPLVGFQEVNQVTSNALNTSGRIPPIKDTWSLLVDSQASDLLHQACQRFRQQTRELVGADGTRRVSTLQDLGNDTIEAFRKGLMAPNASMESELKKCIDDEVRECVENHARDVQKRIESLLHAVTQDVATSPDIGVYLKSIKRVRSEFRDAFGDEDDARVLEDALSARAEDALTSIHKHHVSTLTEQRRRHDDLLQGLLLDHEL